MKPETRDLLIKSLDEGKPVIANCDFGFMLEVRGAKISVPPDGREIRGRAEAEHVRAVIAGWGAKLAAWDEKQAQEQGPAE